VAAFAARRSVAVLPCIGDFDPKGLERLRGKVEEIGDEALFNACKEGGVCFGDLAGKANADYGAWCTVNKYGGKLVLSFELYNVGEKDILYTKEYDEYNPKNADDMVAIIKKEVPNAFRKITGTPSEKASSSSVATPAAAPAVAPAPTVTAVPAAN
jgi:hypothetical protein